MEVPNFILNKQFWVLGPNLPQKGISERKQKKSTSPLKLHIQINVITKFQLNWQFRFFELNLPQKGVSGTEKKRKSELHYWTLQIGISLGTADFSINWQILYFGSLLPKWGISGRKLSGHHFWILNIQTRIGTESQLKLIIFVFQTTFGQKNVLTVKNWKSEHHHWILHIWINLDTKHSWQRDPNPLFYKDPPILLPHFFQFFYCSPPSLFRPTPTPTALSVAFLFWLNYRSCHIVLLNGMMDLHMSSLGTLEPEGTLCVLCIKALNLLESDT